MSIADDLKSLQELHDRGQLTDDEYAAAKAAALKEGPRKTVSAFLMPVGVLLVVAILASLGWRILVRDRAKTGGTQAPVTTASEPEASAPAVPRSYSSQEIFQMASGGMVLIEGFDDENRKRQQGSAFVVSADGTAITNYHVIRGRREQRANSETARGAK